MRASTSASAWISRCRQLSARLPSRPFIWRNACRRWPSVSAITRSARPSTAVRSSLPFSKARRVNSPASAGRRPSMRPSAASTAAITARPPCSCSSAMSSPVSLCGAGNHSASASSMISPVKGSRTRAERRLARGGDLAGERLERLAGARPGHAHDRNRRRPAAGGEGEDGGGARTSRRTEAPRGGWVKGCGRSPRAVSEFTV